MKDRIHYIDLAKGILIILVVYGHIGWVIGHVQGFQNALMEDTYLISAYWGAFYMGAFFVITGYCSNFNISIKDFLVKNLKGLILPAFTLGAIINSISTGGGAFGNKEFN